MEEWDVADRVAHLVLTICGRYTNNNFLPVFSCTPLLQAVVAGLLGIDPPGELIRLDPGVLRNSIEELCTSVATNTQ
jgi:hypothetical protein